MTNELQKKQNNQELVISGFNSSQGFDLIQRGAKLLSQSTLVPKEFQNNLPNCVVALNMANRLGADPLLVMQNIYIVYNRPAWSSKFLIASFNQCGKYTSIDYKWSGKENSDDWGCRAYAKEKATGKEIVGPLITIRIAKFEGWYEKKGSKWRTIPELMLRYRAAGWLVNTYAPEISMGLNTIEEMHDIIDVTPQFNKTKKMSLEGLIDKMESEPEPSNPKTELKPVKPSKPSKPKKSATEIRIHEAKKTLIDILGDEGKTAYYNVLNKAGFKKSTEIATEDNRKYVLSELNKRISELSLLEKAQHNALKQKQVDIRQFIAQQNNGDKEKSIAFFKELAFVYGIKAKSTTELTNKEADLLLTHFKTDKQEGKGGYK